MGMQQLDRLLTRLLDKGYEETTLQTLDGVAASFNSGRVQQRLAELDQEVVRLMLADERLMPDNPVLAALVGDIEAESRRAAGRIDGVAGDVQRSGVEAAARLTRELALPGLSDSQLAGIGLRWNVPDPEAVNALVQFTAKPEWDDALGGMSAQFVKTVRNQAIRGMVEGWSPLRVAREIRRGVEGLSTHQANNLMRTLQLQSYRRATAIHQQANADILDGQIRVAVLDQRTCLACIALHGERLPAGAVIVDHHSGRCTAIATVRGRPRRIETGQEWLLRQSPEYLENMAAFQASPGKLEALRAFKVNVRDFIERYDDPVFGEMVREGSLREALRPSRNREVQARKVRPTGETILTGDGYRTDDGADFDDISTLGGLTEYIERGGLRADYMWQTGALGYSEDGQVSVDRTVLYDYIKRYVQTSRTSYESRDALAAIMQSVMRDDHDVVLTLEGAEQLMNADEARRASAIFRLAQVGKVRLTDAQQRRLTRALDGNYTEMLFEAVGDEGVALNEMEAAKGRRSGVRRDSAEYRRLKAAWDENMRDDRWSR